MSFVADRFVVVLDANVLYPNRMRDIFLRFNQKGLYRARWTDQIMHEWSNALLKTKPHLTENIDHTKTLMRENFEEAWVTNYEPFIEGVTGMPDQNDRHVVAAAIKCGAQQIVTNNLKDFPEEILEPYELEAVSADAFLAGTFELYPGLALNALRQMRVGYQNPPFATGEFILDLMAKGMPKLANLLKPHVDLL